MPQGYDLTRKTLGLLILGLLIGTCFWVVRPFLGPAAWAMMIVVATWPLLLRIQVLLGGRRKSAVLVMNCLLALVFLIPLGLLISAVVGSAGHIAGWVTQLKAEGLPALPAWVAGVPMVGEPISQAWREAGSSGPDGLIARVEPYIGRVGRWLIDQAGGAGSLVVQFVLTLILAGVFYSSGEEAAALIRKFARRIAGSEADSAVLLAASAIRGIALGVVVTAVLQSILGGLGLAIAGVPAAGLWTAVMFILAVAQIGVAPVLLISVGWLFWKGDTPWAIALLVWTIVVTTADNFVRPILIRKGVDLPLLLIFAGVIGGLVAFGIIGVFIGPVVLAVSYTLLTQWMDSTESA